MKENRRRQLSFCRMLTTRHSKLAVIILYSSSETHKKLVAEFHV
jgi:hypothetical protein